MATGSPTFQPVVQPAFPRRGQRFGDTDELVGRRRQRKEGSVDGRSSRDGQAKKTGPGPAFLMVIGSGSPGRCLPLRESKVLRPVNLIVDGFGVSRCDGIEAHHGAAFVDLLGKTHPWGEIFGVTTGDPVDLEIFERGFELGAQLSARRAALLLACKYMMFSPSFISAARRWEVRKPGRCCLSR